MGARRAVRRHAEVGAPKASKRSDSHQDRKQLLESHRRWRNVDCLPCMYDMDGGCCMKRVLAGSYLPRLVHKSTPSKEDEYEA